MKRLTIFFLFISQISFSQSIIVAETLDKIELNQDTIKSVFDWVANNIKYDVKKLNKISSEGLMN
jgi:hypothetical protein